MQAYTQEAALQANEVGTYWEFTDEQLQAAELLDASVTAIRRIVEYARDKGIEIVLCAAPYMTNRAEEKLFAQVGELADELGVPFVGLEESGIEGLQYMRDLGHLNDRGARLYTEFWSDYLADHYDLPDRHESADSRYTPWREGTGRYDVQHAAMSLIGMETGLTGYLEALAALDGDYLVLISAQASVRRLHRKRLAADDRDVGHERPEAVESGTIPAQARLMECAVEEGCLPAPMHRKAEPKRLSGICWAMR